MKIVIGSDMGGYDVRQHLITVLTKQGHQLKDVGTSQEDRVGHPTIAREATKEFLSGGYDFGILVCASGTGICIAANKVNGIRCALLNNFFSAKIAKECNKANFIAFGGKTINPLDAEKLVAAYLEYEYLASEDWVTQWDKEINEIEAEN